MVSGISLLSRHTIHAGQWQCSGQWLFIGSPSCIQWASLWGVKSGLTAWHDASVTPLASCVSGIDDTVSRGWWQEDQKRSCAGESNPKSETSLGKRAVDLIMSHIRSSVRLLQYCWHILSNWQEILWLSLLFQNNWKECVYNSERARQMPIRERADWQEEASWVIYWFIDYYRGLPHRCDRTWGWRHSPGETGRAHRPQTNTSSSVASPPPHTGPRQLKQRSQNTILTNPWTVNYCFLHQLFSFQQWADWFLNKLWLGWFRGHPFHVLLRISSTMKGSKRILSMLSSKQ